MMVKWLSLLHCLQDEMEELRSEMLEMRDMYMEEDVYQLQELRQQLEQVQLRVDASTPSPNLCYSKKQQIAFPYVSYVYILLSVS